MINFTVHRRVRESSTLSTSVLLDFYNQECSQITEKTIERNREKYGSNREVLNTNDSIWKRWVYAFITPFSIVLFIIAIIYIVIDIVEQRKDISVLTIFIMILISGMIRFFQEFHSKKITDQLISFTDFTVRSFRNCKWKDVSSEDLVVGDYVRLNVGDRIPADIRVMKCKDLFVSESIITGESGIQEKNEKELDRIPAKITDYKNIIFKGTTIMSGMIEGIVMAVGKDTVYGDTASIYSHEKNGFDKGSNSIAWVLIRFMLLLVPIVFISSGVTKGNWTVSFLFSLSVAVGLTPELLPMVITACLAKGTFTMWKKQTIVKNLNAMQSFGSMDVLCVDKTGTLTEDKLVLEYFMDVFGNESQKVLELSYLNSFYSTGVGNQIDSAILKANTMPGKEEYYADLIHKFIKEDELPFDYERKISTVLLNHDSQHILVSKGAFKEMIERCSYIEYKGKTYDIGKDALKNTHEIIDEMIDDGMKVIAIATKTIQESIVQEKDESGFTLLGFLAFFDAPKKNAIAAIEKLKNLNIPIKVLTGDNENITVSICKRIGMDVDKIITGKDLSQMNEDQLLIAVEHIQVFAELLPRQKSNIISLLQKNGHTVGFLGNGMNDLPAILASDVGISVDTAVNSVKELSDVILLKKDLGVLEKGILEGRKSFINMTKYIKITASSNLGNILSIVLASIFLPFFPMTSLQILMLNMLYDILCLVLPWDEVDEELYQKPLEWNGKDLGQFMIYFAPISSFFDVITFGFLFFYLCPMLCGGNFVDLTMNEQAYFISIFQTGWFLESMWSQVLILHLLRTEQIPLIQSRPNRLVFFITVAGIITLTCISMSSIGSVLGLTKLPINYFVFLIIVVLVYLLSVTFAKKLYIQRFKHLL